jgi:hypothetical protein
MIDAYVLEDCFVGPVAHSRTSSSVAKVWTRTSAAVGRHVRHFATDPDCHVAQALVDAVKVVAVELDFDKHGLVDPVARDSSSQQIVAQVELFETALSNGRKIGRQRARQLVVIEKQVMQSGEGSLARHIDPVGRYAALKPIVPKVQLVQRLKSQIGRYGAIKLIVR